MRRTSAPGRSGGAEPAAVTGKFPKRHGAAIRWTYRRLRAPKRSIEGGYAILTIFSVLLALLSDALMNSVSSSVVSTRQQYLAEFGRYLDRQGPAEWLDGSPPTV